MAWSVKCGLLKNSENAKIITPDKYTIAYSTTEGQALFVYQNKVIFKAKMNLDYLTEITELKDKFIKVWETKFKLSTDGNTMPGGDAFWMDGISLTNGTMIIDVISSKTEIHEDGTLSFLAGENKFKIQQSPESDLLKELITDCKDMDSYSIIDPAIKDEEKGSSTADILIFISWLIMIAALGLGFYLLMQDERIIGVSVMLSGLIAGIVQINIAEINSNVKAITDREHNK